MRQLASLRSPMKYATICLVRRQSAIQTHRLKDLQYTYDHNSSNSKTSFFLAGSNVFSVSGRDLAFFYPIRRCLPPDAEGPRQPAKRTALLSGPNHQLFSRFISTTAFDNTARSAWFAFETRVSNAVATIFYQFLWPTDGANSNFDYHVFGANIFNIQSWTLPYLRADFPALRLFTTKLCSKFKPRLYFIWQVWELLPKIQ